MSLVGRRKRSSIHNSSGGPLDSDEEDEAYEHKSDLTGHRTVILKGGMEPKLEMRKKIVRQSDLITSLEKSEIRKNEEMLALRQKVREQEATIAEMQQQRLKAEEEEKNAIYPEIVEPANVIEEEPHEDGVVAQEVTVAGQAQDAEAENEKEEEQEAKEDEIDLFEASGELKIFDTPGIDGIDKGGAKSDRSVSELEGGHTMDKWNNHEYQEYMNQLKKRHGAGTDSGREELERQAIAMMRASKEKKEKGGQISIVNDNNTAALIDKDLRHITIKSPTLQQSKTLKKSVTKQATPTKPSSIMQAPIGKPRLSAVGAAGQTD